MKIHSKLATVFITIGVIIGVTVLCRLGFWQLARGHEKDLLLEQQALAHDYAPLNTQQIQAYITNAPEKIRFYPVKLTGQFSNNHTVLLDNKIYKGQVGYHVYVPLLLTNRSTRTAILINRGWIPQGRSRSSLPTVLPIKGEVTIEGSLDFAYRNPLIPKMLETDIIQWPLRVQELNMAQLSSILDEKLYPMVVNIDPHSAYAFDANQPGGPWLNPERHRAYAFQWFSLAVTLLILSIITYFFYRPKP